MDDRGVLRIRRQLVVDDIAIHVLKVGVIDFDVKPYFLNASIHF